MAPWAIKYLCGEGCGCSKRVFNSSVPSRDSGLVHKLWGSWWYPHNYHISATDFVGYMIITNFWIVNTNDTFDLGVRV